jgi:hypothetical protein
MYAYSITKVFYVKKNLGEGKNNLRYPASPLE